MNKFQSCRSGQKEKKVLNSNCKTGFIGFKICIESLKSIIKNYILPENSQLKYFPFYKISQDHLEIFFSCLRYHGGNNNNSTAGQFRTAYKKLLVNAELKPSYTGNCIPLS